jgi:carboxypeptidase family protein/TonB-dependent receptor-like protein
MKTTFFLLIAILIATPLFSETVEIAGRAADPSGAVIPGASVVVMDSANSIAATTTTANDGQFTLQVAPGSYMLSISASGFDDYEQPVTVASNAPPLSITLSVAKITQEIEVQEDPDLITLDPENNQTALVLKEDDIQSLPDDEEDMIAYLTELAGPRAAAAGGVQFIIDGFQSGRLPPKDQIKEIRINTNPFTTEFSRSGFGRIEIITRPGTGRMRGNLNFNLRNDTLNARNAFAPIKLPYSRQNYQAAVGGPLIENKLSLTMLAQRNDQFNTDTIRAITGDGPLSSSIQKPSLRENYNARGQYALTPNNTLNFNLEYGTNHRANQGVGGFGLPERAFTSDNRQTGFQVRNTAVLSSRFVNETRFEFNRNNSATNPLTMGPAINVLDAFQAGGAQNQSNATDKAYLFGNTLIFNSKGFTLKTGGQIDYHQNRLYNPNNFLGTFVFSSLDAYRTGTPTTFTINSGNPLINVSQLELGAFAQTDIKLSKSLLLSPGIRYQAQSNISDRNDFDPRVALSYQLNKATVFRVGLGIFHQTFAPNLVEQLRQLDGKRQQQIVIRNPSFPDPFAGGMAQILPTSLRVASDNLVTPYTANMSYSVERSFKTGSVLSVSYDFIRGVHLYRSRNMNAPLPGTLVRPDPSQGNILQLESTGLSTFKGLTFGWRQRITPTLNLFTSYTFSSSYRDTDGAFSLPANSYALASEWGPSSDNQRNHFSFGLNGRLPWNISVNTMVRANSGRPYNITTGFDDNGDTITNDRPLGIGHNTGVGPALFDTNLNFSKTVSLRKEEKIEVAGPAGGGQRPGFGGRPGAFGGGGGRPGGGGGGVRGPGGGGRPGGNQQAGPTATIFVNVQNLLNHTNFANYSGVLTSPFFGRANAALNPRQIELGVRFNF